MCISNKNKVAVLNYKTAQKSTIGYTFLNPKVHKNTYARFDGPMQIAHV
jgi:hypothetical protein